ncbi:hypothetical protein J3A83DRAFT_2200375 [Scleroderma citrinum]
MAVVVTSPYPADDLPPMSELLPAIQMQWETRVAITVFLLYEYLLTLDQEIDHIWMRRWKPSTALYVFVRYFGTLYNVTATVIMLIPRSDNVVLLNFNYAGVLSSCQFLFGADAWAGSIIWWAVQVILQMRLYALYNCSKKLLVFMVTFFAAEILISAADTFAEHIIFTGLYTNETDLCAGETIPAYGHIWVPCLTFDAILVVLAVWAGIKHSRQQSYSRSETFNRPRLVDVLIHGNVIYFLSPLVTFVLLVQTNVSLEVQWLADTLLFRAPITISAGCRLILSIRQATSPPKPYSISTWMTSSTAVSGDTTAHTSRGR